MFRALLIASTRALSADRNVQHEALVPRSVSRVAGTGPACRGRREGEVGKTAGKAIGHVENSPWRGEQALFFSPWDNSVALVQACMHF